MTTRVFTCWLLFLTAALPAVEPVLFGVDYREADKQGHFWLGAAVAGSSMLALEQWDPDAKWYTKMLIGAGAAAVVGAAKEYADSKDPLNHCVEKDDFVATATGGLVIALTFSWSF